MTYSSLKGCHVQRPDVFGDKFELVLYFVQCTARDLQQRNFYTLASEVRQLGHWLKQEGSVNPVHRALRQKFAHLLLVSESEPTPVSNTGVTPDQLSILEGYIDGKC